MSLLLDARKKSQETLATLSGERRSKSGLSLEPLPNAVPSSAPSSEDSARNAGQNLFQAKLSSASPSRSTINRNLLYTLGGAMVLLAIGASYVWYAISDNSPQPISISRPTPAPVALVTPSVVPPQNSATAEVVKNGTAPNNVTTIRTTGKAQKPFTKRIPQRASDQNPSDHNTPDTASPTAPIQAIHIQPQSTESLDPLLGRAYAAYRSGKLDEARQLYLNMLGKDVQNSDALLGLAAIAQQRGEDRIAAQYYSRVLNLDPRNAVANAGMSALSSNDNSESRLKILLREQGNSAALHFALGNLYAEQSRWGEAQQAYFNAYTLDSKNADLAFNLAVSLDHLGQSKLAAQYYQRALQLDKSGNANFNHEKISQHIEDLLR